VILEYPRGKLEFRCTSGVLHWLFNQHLLEILLCGRERKIFGNSKGKILGKGKVMYEGEREKGPFGGHGRKGS
jgi:hypothetical protein